MKHNIFCKTKPQLILVIKWDYFHVNCLDKLKEMLVHRNWRQHAFHNDCHEISFHIGNGNQRFKITSLVFYFQFVESVGTIQRFLLVPAVVLISIWSWLINQYPNPNQMTNNSDRPPIRCAIDIFVNIFPFYFCLVEYKHL